MFDQTTVGRSEGANGYQAAPIRNFEADSGGVRRLLSDITELVELQTRLITSDAKCLSESAVRPVMLAVSGLVLLLGALPVLLLSAANFLVQRFDWSLAFAQSTAAGVTILTAVVLCILAVKGLNACGSPLSRSMAELEKNMETLRAMLGGASTPSSQMGNRESTN